MIGALHGTKWIPKDWYDNIEDGKGPEKGTRGRTFILATSKTLAKIDPTTLKAPVYDPKYFSSSSASAFSAAASSSAGDTQ
jgi:hypothetical protein